MTLLIVLALSSYSQCLFGLEGRAGLARYHLLPLSGWHVLAAKDAAFLAVAVPLILPLAPLAGTGAALIVLAMGHGPSVTHIRPQTRWRFSTGSSVGLGLLQAMMMAIAGSAIFFSSAFFFLPCVLIAAGSLWHYGQEFERIVD